MLQSKENTRIGKGYSGQDTRRTATDVKSHPVSDRSELILDQKRLREAIGWVRR